MCEKNVWIKSVSDLCDTIAGKAKSDPDIKVVKGNEFLQEDSGDAYAIKSVLLQKSNSNVVVKPVSRFINQYDGRVDVYRNGVRVCALVLKNSKWGKLNAIKKFPNLLALRETPFRPEGIVALLTNKKRTVRKKTCHV